MANGFDTAEESYVGDDPTGIGYDEAGTSVASGVGYGSLNIDTGGNETTGEVLSQAGFNQAMNISTKNPYGDQGFFTRVFGIPAQYLDYRPLGIDTGGIANLAYDRYRNPFAGIKDNEVIPGSGIKEVDDVKLREGLSEGEKTRFGEVVSIDRPQGIGETIARTAFGLGTPLGPLTSFIGTDQLALAPDDKIGFSGSPNYDPKLDPNNPEYQGPQSFLGQLGSGLERVTFGGARPVTEGTKGIMSLFEAQEAEKEMKDSVDQTGKNVLEESSVSLMEPGANLASSFNTSRTRYGDLPTTIKEGNRNITNPNIALAIGIMNKEPGVDFSQAYKRAQMELAKRKKFGIK